MNQAIKSKLQSAALALVSIAVALVLAEGVARVFVDAADFQQVELTPDEVLGHRIKPGAGGHDALGFRNREVPAHVETLAIGDSMTYGFGTPRDTAWPHQLASLGGQSVYNMAMGGYGPLQYLQLTRDGIGRFAPKRVVIGFYFGNDLLDAYILSHAFPKWYDWRLTTDTPPGATTGPAGAEEPARRFGALREWLTQKSLLYSLLKATVFEPFAVMSQRKIAKEMSPDDRMTWTDPAAPEIHTVFTPRDRMWVQDLSQASAKEGMAIAQRAFAAIKDETDRSKVELLVVLIPTRERVYCPYLKSTGAALPQTYTKLCAIEEATKAELLQGFAAKGIAYVDSTPALEAEVAKHVHIYPATSDGHPTATGQKVIAETVLRALKRPAAASSPTAPLASR